MGKEDVEMSRTKKLLLSVIIALIGIISIATVSSAYYVGQSLSITYSQYASDSDIYCVEHGQSLRYRNYYKIISEVDIKGKTSTDHTGKQITHDYNAKLAYILSGDNGTSGKANGEVANAIWNFMYTWMGKVGQYHEGLYNGFVSNVKGNKTTTLFI